MSLWNYSAEDISIILAGVYKVEGYETDTFVRVTKDVQPFQTVRTVDGKVYRKNTNDSTFTIELTLLSTSPSNDVLTKLWELDEVTGMAKFPLFIKDHLGTGFFHSATTWVEQIPPLTYSSGKSVNNWVLRSSQGVINIGGNDPAGTAEKVATLLLSGLPLVSQTLQDLSGGS